MSADYIMVGGFLGAGKTTAMLRLAEHLTGQGRRVGLITNDQSHGLVDTSIVGGQGLSRSGDHRRMLLLPLQFVDRRGRPADTRAPVPTSSSRSRSAAART